MGIKTTPKQLIPSIVGDLVRVYRTHAAMSTHQLAALSGVTQGTISQIELGYTIPSDTTLRGIAHALKLGKLERASLLASRSKTFETRQQPS